MKGLKTSVTSELKEMSNQFEASLEGYDWEEEDYEPGNEETPDTARLDTGHDISEEEEGDIPQNEEKTETTGEPSNAGQSIFSRLAQELQGPSNTAMNVDEDLATFINLVCSQPLRTDEFLKLKDSIKRPPNCTELQVPPVPEAIYVKLGEEVKSPDEYFQRLHGDILAFVIMIIRSLNDLNKLIPVCPQIVKSVEEITQSMKLFGIIHRNGFIEHRRKILRPHLPGDYKRLAGSSYPSCPSSLFGAELEDSIKSIDNIAKLANKIKDIKNPVQGRYQPYQRGRGRDFRRGRGRSRGRGWRGSSSQDGQAGQSQNQTQKPQGFRGRGAPTQK